jgi:hypothetical protein
MTCLKRKKVSFGARIGLLCLIFAFFYEWCMDSRRVLPILGASLFFIF